MWSRLCASVSHSDGSFLLLCFVCVYVSVCGPVYALVYPTVMGRSSCCVVCISVCGPVYALVYFHSDGPFFLLCCLCLYVVPSMRWCIPQWWVVPLVLCMSVCGPVFELVYPIVTKSRHGQEFFLLFDAQTGSGAHPSSCPVGLGSSIPGGGVKRQEHNVIIHLQLVPRSGIVVLTFTPP
jgi:hypothetical protein